ncbi:MFS general substrate transporter [Cucurbitaria berberidis CBS 394.84]|uniref:MFS general substrate transporter n=1 Tax=Cucurbitaria berberidis CBS 394.84 TaxID=1168544 RepID=A0A9P4GNB9_9PLEO|nr:MFS general substrate transporter [Cucurbitaria berberidis CBS 394.84]KAF1849628.1 MFS general substrate transporter [Cucurbitaria berberidis CBS 394.84]
MERARISESEDWVPEMMDSYRTSKRSSLSLPRSSKHHSMLTDSAISLVHIPKEKRMSTKSHLQHVQSADDEPESPTSMTESEQSEDRRPSAIPAYPSAAKTAVIMVSLYISIFLVALDRTIVGPAIPAITNQFNSIGDIGWYGSSYMLTCAGFILLYGRIYTFFPTKPVFLSGIFLFEAGSAICGAAQNSLMLIVGRAIAGLGSSGIFTGAILIMLNTVPLHRRPMLQGLFGACFGVASVAGPLLGGAFTGSKATWRWCFYINLPLGGITILVVCFLLKLDEQKPKLATWKETVKHLDPLGTALFLPSITCLLLALEWGAADYSWSSPRLIALLVIFAVLLVAFIVWQYFTQHTTATIPARVIFQRSVAFGSVSQFCVGATMLTVSIYIPLWFQAIKGVSAMQSGINTIPLVLSVVVGSILSGGLVQRVGYYTPFMILGSSFMAVGTGLLTTWNMGISTGMWIGYQIIIGFGVGCTMQHPNIAVQTVLPKHDVPIGTAVLSLFQTLGGAVFTAVGQNLYIDKFSSGLERIGGLVPGRILNAGATDMTSAVPMVLKHRVLEAYNHALTNGTFFAALIVACISVPAALGMEWRSVKEKQGATQAPAVQDEEKQESLGEDRMPPGILKRSTTQSSRSEMSTAPSLAPPVPAWKNLYRSSGQFSSYLTTKVNPDLRAELRTVK